MAYTFKQKLIPICASGMLLISVGCNQVDNAQTLSVNSVNGSYPLSSVYPYSFNACVFDDTKNYDVRPVKTLSGQTHTSDFYTYTSTDGSCSGIETRRYRFVYQVSVPGETTVSWDFSTVPDRADGTGSLPDPVTVSKVYSVITEITDYVPDDSYNITTTVGTELKRLIYADDSNTGVPVTVYVDSPFGGTDADGYPLLLDPDPIYHPIP
jgi:hypothetical protein